MRFVEWREKVSAWDTMREEEGLLEHNLNLLRGGEWSLTREEQKGSRRRGSGECCI